MFLYLIFQDRGYKYLPRTDLRAIFEMKYCQAHNQWTKEHLIRYYVLSSKYYSVLTVHESNNNKISLDPKPKLSKQVFTKLQQFKIPILAPI